MTDVLQTSEQVTVDQLLPEQSRPEPSVPDRLVPQQRLPDLVQAPTQPAAELEPIVPADPQEAVRLAAEHFQKGKDWVSFYRDVCGVGGIIRRMYPKEEDAKAFKQTPEYAEIQRMMTKLRERPRNQNESDEPTKVITVRLPQSLHESLRCEAHENQTSMNQLCISKLLQIINSNLTTSD